MLSSPSIVLSFQAEHTYKNFFPFPPGSGYPWGKVDKLHKKEHEIGMHLLYSMWDGLLSFLLAFWLIQGKVKVVERDESSCECSSTFVQQGL